MVRVVSPLLSFALALCIALAAISGAYMRLQGGLANAGQQTIVICGSHGPQSVILGRNGEPVEPGKSGSCAHCADCALQPLATLPGWDFAARHPKSETGIRATIMPQAARAERVWVQSRGPPSSKET